MILCCLSDKALIVHPTVTGTDEELLFYYQFITSRGFCQAQRALGPTPKEEKRERGDAPL
jgi:hypothetical protein